MTIKIFKNFSPFGDFFFAVKKFFLLNYFLKSCCNVCRNFGGDFMAELLKNPTCKVKVNVYLNHRRILY